MMAASDESLARSERIRPQTDEFRKELHSIRETNEKILVTNTSIQRKVSLHIGATSGPIKVMHKIV